MPIDVSCTSCSKKLRVPDNAAGKRIKCPQCKAPISVPSGSLPTSAGAAPSVPTSGGESWYMKTEGGEDFAEWSWLRLPKGAPLNAVAGPDGAEVWVKEGHLAKTPTGPSV